jgi:hypothetical protein
MCTPTPRTRRHSFHQILPDLTLPLPSSEKKMRTLTWPSPPLPPLPPSLQCPTTQVDQLLASRTQRDQLLVRVFATPAWLAYPELAALRAAAAELERRAAEEKGHSEVYQRANTALQASANKIAQAMAALQRTRMVNTFEIGMDIGRGRGGRTLGADIAQMMMIRRANDLVKDAANDVIQARTILPTIPFTDTGALGAAKAGVFVSVLAPGILGSMAERMLIRKSMASVTSMQSQVAECIRWVQSNMSGFAASAAGLHGQADAKRREVVAFETSHLEAAITQ